MFTLKYQDKIDAAIKAEEDHPVPLPPFDVNELGVDSTVKRAMRQLFTWGLLLAFWLMRWLWPNPRIGRLVIVSRYDDVRDVLDRRDCFQVPFRSEMETLTRRPAFFLGLDGQEHDTQIGYVQNAIDPEAASALAHANYLRRAIDPKVDAPSVLAHARDLTTALLDHSGGRIDFVRDLVTRVATETCGRYFGLDIDDPNGFADRLMAMSNLLFADPFGDPPARTLARSAAVEVRNVLDRSIAHAVEQAGKKQAEDTLTYRLAEQHLADPALSPETMRAILMGMATGFIPTTALAAGKMIEELLRHEDFWQTAIKHARNAEAARAQGTADNVDRKQLKKILLEAGRLNPALAGGVWRRAAQDCTLGTPTGHPRAVREGDVLLVATVSALRDKRVFPDPEAFKPGRFQDRETAEGSKGQEDRGQGVTLMFGDGSHYCIGEHLAMELITEIFQIVLAQDKIRASDNPVGWMSWIGGFPRRLDLKFTPSRSPIEQTMVLVCIPAKQLLEEEATKARKEIEKLGNPVDPNGAFGRALEATGRVHFASFSLVDVDENENSRKRQFLLEINVDGDGAAGIAAVAEKAGSHFKRILADYAEGYTEDLAGFLQRHWVKLHCYPYGAIGLKYSGTSEFPIYDIERQDQLAKFAAVALDEFARTEARNSGSPGARPLKALEFVRKFLREDTRKAMWADPTLSPARRKVLEAAEPWMVRFMIRPSRRRLAISEWLERDLGEGAAAFFASGPVRFAGFMLGALALALSTSIYYVTAPYHWLATATWIGSLVLFAAIVLYAVIPDEIDRLGLGLAKIGRALPHIMVGGFCLAVLGFSGAFLWLIWPHFHDSWRVLACLAALPVGLTATIAAIGLIFFPRALLKRIGVPGWIALAALLVAGTVWAIVNVGVAGHLLAAAVTGLAATVLIVLAVLGVFLIVLRTHELSAGEKADDKQPGFDDVKALIEREDHPGYAQNHLTSVTQLKAGWFRKLTLAGSLWGIGKLILHWYRPGFVLDMGTIHYAQWFRLPGTEKLIFLTNYDGSWESYLEDFITKAPKGQTAAWGHGVGFPRLQYLLFGGARDGDRFKRWVRRQQVVTQCWYSRFPKLTTNQIRNNALIHDGLMRAHTDTAARAWIDCFGTVPRPDYAIEDDEVQSLVFRGFGELPCVSYALVPLPDNAPDAYHRWLMNLNERMTFGDRRLAPNGEHKCATFVAFSASGLDKIGFAASRGIYDAKGAEIEGDRLLDKFPAAFKVGMSQRPRVMGDLGSDAPDYWKWADTAVAPSTERRDPPTVADALIVIYGPSLEDCDAEISKHRGWIGGDTSNWRIIEGTPTDPEEPADPEEPEDFQKNFKEHFGFRDGISQPVIRGTRRYAATTLARDLVEPGEFILGYRNNQHYYPPTPTIDSRLDPDNILPTDVPDFAARFPRFRIPRISDQRDFGRNGTYLAVREFVQHVDEFWGFADRQAQTLRAKYPDLPSRIGGEIDAEWVAAKMMGRWQDGVSLIARPNKGDAPGKPDNDFDFGTLDPQGLQCPFGAHIRRANPRDSLQPGSDEQLKISNRHRILRRGRSYANGNEKGLFFMAVCGDLERQFEFVQQTWIGSPSFHGLRNEPDPIIAARGENSIFTIPTSSQHLQLTDIRSFVTVRGGGYFFMPSRSALLFLCQRNRIISEKHAKAKSLSESDPLRA